MSRPFGAPFGSYTVQTWKGDTRVHPDIEGLSIDAARHIAEVHAGLGFTARVMVDRHDYDYCEVYTSEEMRAGTFAETTLVRA